MMQQEQQGCLLRIIKRIKPHDNRNPLPNPMRSPISGGASVRLSRIRLDWLSANETAGMKRRVMPWYLRRKCEQYIEDSGFNLDSWSWSYEWQEGVGGAWAFWVIEEWGTPRGYAAYIDRFGDIAGMV